MLIGLTGKYCSGKSEAAKFLAEKGLRIIDADALGHQVLEERKEEVAAAFGNTYITSDGRIERRSLGRLVFADAEKLLTLEAIVHPRVKEKIAALLAASDEPTVIHAALLFYGGLDALCSRIIIVEAPLLDRINRALARDNLGIWAVFRRIRKQKNLIPQFSQLPADTLVVKNAGTRGELREAVFAALSRLERVWNGTKYF
ncbi:MAG: dephospho-CoA kinase [Spirochaetales bacterium]|jgi:dephospho-CoA kinase|nr:dephospho-CoA kinase [Spirochaetales bacterium]